MTTASTPPEVAYYLDQAARSQAVVAFTATVVMYRAALEHLRLEQGYDQKMPARRSTRCSTTRARCRGASSSTLTTCG